jgi:hypothetical protein
MRKFILLVVAVVVTIAVWLLVMENINDRRRKAIVADQVRPICMSLTNFPTSSDSDAQSYITLTKNTREGLASWRTVIWVEHHRDYLPDERHPIFCSTSNATEYLAIDYPGAPWGMQLSQAFQPKQIALIHLPLSTVRWNVPGDLVLKKQKQNQEDIDEEQFLKMPGELFCVGFTDGTSIFMTKNEIMQTATNNGVPVDGK